MQRVTEDVVVVGSPSELPAGFRTIEDRQPGQGPLGGVEAALTDAASAGKNWAVFLPVDMPLVPGGLLRALSQLWMAEDASRIGFAGMDGQPQPLVSAIHVAALPCLRASLERGDRKFRPVLESAAAELAASSGKELASVLQRSEVHAEGKRVWVEGVGAVSWQPSDTEWSSRESWFSNVNTPSQLETIAKLFDTI